MTLHSTPITMWFDHRIAYRKSPIHGTGTFALEAIPAGTTLVLVTGGIIYDPKDAENGTLPFDGMLYNGERLSDTQYIATPLAHHYCMNHSCAPNVIDLSRHPATSHRVTLRDIQPNEELTHDYYTRETLEVCLCGSALCRWKA
jgi:uncharacterized protein